MRESYFKLFNVQQIKTQYGLPLQSFQKIFSTSTTLKKHSKLKVSPQLFLLFFNNPDSEVSLKLRLRV